MSGRPDGRKKPPQGDGSSSERVKNRHPCQARAYSLCWAAVLTKRGACA